MDVGKLHNVYFIGAGGAGISALMKLMLDRGARVFGSDVNSSERTRELSRLGAKIFKGENLSAAESAELIVYTSAVSPDNAELRAARAKGVPVMERHEFLGAVSKTFDKVIAVAGTHGKTTVTAMLAHIFKKTGKSFCALIGGDSVDFGNYVSRSGEGENFFITEACEYRRGLLSLFPDVGVITNVEPDHPDCYKDLADVCGVFSKFSSQCKSRIFGEGAYEALYDHICADEHIGSAAFERWGNLPKKGGREALSLSGEYRVFSDSGVYICKNEHAISGGNAFELRLLNERYKAKTDFSGACALENAAAAVAAAHEAGISIADACAALCDFHGVKRRFEQVGELSGARIVFDFAHHPTELKAAIATAKKAGRTLAVFQPHTYSRTAQYLDDFCLALSLSDEVVLTPTYGARETEDKGLPTVAISKRMSELYQDKPIFNADSLYEALGRVVKRAADFDAVIFLGAGNIYDLASFFKAR